MIQRFITQGEGFADVFFANATVADDTRFALYWARPIVGTIRQVAVAKWDDGHISFIENTCGQALIKFQEGWWPNRPHRNLAVNETYEQLLEIRLPEKDWNQYDYKAAVAEADRISKMEKELYKDHPEFERMSALKRLINKAPIN